MDSRGPRGPFCFVKAAPRLMQLAALLLAAWRGSRPANRQSSKRDPQYQAPSASTKGRGAKTRTDANEIGKHELENES